MTKEQREAVKSLMHAGNDFLRAEKAARSLKLSPEILRDVLSLPMQDFMSAVDEIDIAFNEEIELTKG